MWQSPPVLIDPQRAIFPAEGDRIKAIELATGREIWSRRLDGLPSLTGSAPQLRRDGSFVLALVERNYGYELERWSIDTGASLDHARFLGAEPVDLAASALGPGAFILVADRMLFAIDRESGKRLWEFPLPKRGRERWLARPARSAVLVFPEFALPHANFDWLRDQAGREWAGVPTLDHFQTAASILYHGYLVRSFPLLAIDRKAGKKMQELNFPVFGPRNALLLGDRLVVVSEGKLIRFD